jgi:lactoylglutathione lyase
MRLQASYDHICLTVTDIERSLAFYERYFGFKPVRRDKPHSGPLVETMTGVPGGELLAAFASDGNFVLELIQFTRAGGERTISAPANEIGSAHIGFSVPDVREAYRSLSEEGVHFNGAPVMSSRGDSWSVMMSDPDGVSIELRETSAITGAMRAVAIG